MTLSVKATETKTGFDDFLRGEDEVLDSFYKDLNVLDFCLLERNDKRSGLCCPAATSC